MMRRRIGIVMLIVCGTLSALGTLVWIRQRNMAVYQRASAEAQSRAVDRDREAAGTTLAPDVAEALKTFEANLAFDHSGALLLTTVRPPGPAAAKDANQYHLLIYDLAHPVGSPHVLVSCDAPSAAWDTSAAAVYALQQRDGQDRLVKLEVDGRAVAESPQFPLARRGQHGALSYSRSAALVACVQPVEGAQFLILWWPGSGVLKRASLPSPFVAAPNTPPCISGDGSQVAAAAMNHKSIAVADLTGSRDPRVSLIPALPAKYRGMGGPPDSLRFLRIDAQGKHLWGDEYSPIICGTPYIGPHPAPLPPDGNLARLEIGTAGVRDDFAPHGFGLSVFRDALLGFSVSDDMAAAAFVYFVPSPWAKCQAGCIVQTKPPDYYHGADLFRKGEIAAAGGIAVSPDGRRLAVYKITPPTGELALKVLSLPDLKEIASWPVQVDPR